MVIKTVCVDCMYRVHPSLVTQQPPPPYYPSSGLENKALEHSLDLALDDPAKSPVYASQNGYGYHGNPPPQGPQGHNINGGECKSNITLIFLPLLSSAA